MTQPTPSQNAFDLLKSGGLKFSQSQKQSGRKRRASSDQQEKYATCPVCGLSVPKAFIELHASDCLAAQVPLEATLFLEGRSDGSWACHWWSEGSPCPQEGLTAAWSATINATIPKQAAAAAAAAGGSSSGISSKAPDIPNGSTKLRLQAGAVPAQGPARLRGESMPARLALYLLKDAAGCEALLRRLSIICLEDGLLHPQLPLVVWAMLANGKGYVLGGSLANALLAITYQMAAVEWRDFLPDADAVRGPSAAVYQAPRTWQAVDALLPPASPEALLVRVMLIRAAYGGMDGDKEMLLRFSGLWLARFSGSAQLPPDLPQQQQQGAGQRAPGGQHQQQQDLQQQQQQQQQQQASSIPGRKGPASSEGLPAAVSPWLDFLRAAYQDLWEGLSKPTNPAAAPAANVMLVGPITRDDIPLAAVDFHVASNLTEHLLAQQPLQAALRAAAAASTPIAAQLTGLGPASLVNSTLWLFRSSYNRKAWLQERYQQQQQQQQQAGGYAQQERYQQQQQQQQQQAGGYAQQVLAMELEALGRWRAEQRSKRQALLPLWRVMALMADAWSRDLIQRKLG
ncbi:hypothetical protein OEZ85_003222 [Tetradesmus obliquus]|uniref:UBZ4-type domain-containing protein n=1 Tax=Tetradesmus obliquus TaxID=3088 RepID=A0ABY8U0V1_TETOB|nr:hypothetical protein OEZ85_003222 [Tetradesmus obliquus]